MSLAKRFGFFQFVLKYFYVDGRKLNYARTAASMPANPATPATPTLPAAFAPVALGAALPEAVTDAAGDVADPDAPVGALLLSAVGAADALALPP